MFASRRAVRGTLALLLHLHLLQSLHLARPLIPRPEHDAVGALVDAVELLELVHAATPGRRVEDPSDVASGGRRRRRGGGPSSRRRVARGRRLLGGGPGDVVREIGTLGGGGASSAGRTRRVVEIVEVRREALVERRTMRGGRRRSPSRNLPGLLLARRRVAVRARRSHRRDDLRHVHGSRAGLEIFRGAAIERRVPRRGGELEFHRLADHLVHVALVRGGVGGPRRGRVSARVPRVRVGFVVVGGVVARVAAPARARGGRGGRVGIVRVVVPTRGPARGAGGSAGLAPAPAPGGSAADARGATVARISRAASTFAFFARSAAALACSRMLLDVLGAGPPPPPVPSEPPPPRFAPPMIQRGSGREPRRALPRLPRTRRAERALRRTRRVALERLPRESPRTTRARRSCRPRIL